jgi:hypothetical protein
VGTGGHRGTGGFDEDVVTARRTGSVLHQHPTLFFTPFVFTTCCFGLPLASSKTAVSAGVERSDHWFRPMSCRPKALRETGFIQASIPLIVVDYRKPIVFNTLLLGASVQPRAQPLCSKMVTTGFGG